MIVVDAKTETGPEKGELEKTEALEDRWELRSVVKKDIFERVGDGCSKSFRPGKSGSIRSLVRLYRQK